MPSLVQPWHPSCQQATRFVRPCSRFALHSEPWCPWPGSIRIVHVQVHPWVEMCYMCASKMRLQDQKNLAGHKQKDGLGQKKTVQNWTSVRYKFIHGHFWTGPREKHMPCAAAQKGMQKVFFCGVFSETARIYPREMIPTSLQSHLPLQGMYIRLLIHSERDIAPRHTSTCCEGRWASPFAK